MGRLITSLTVISAFLLTAQFADARFFGGYGDSYNLYLYVRGNPVVHTDPSGLVGQIISSGPVTVGVNIGPWKCRPEQIEDCQKQCAAKGGTFKGCVWVGDIQIDFNPPNLNTGRVGTFFGFKHCCCDDEKLPKEKCDAARRKWDNYRDKFRKEIENAWGAYPSDDNGKPWPVHHVDPIQVGGDPIDHKNLLPAPPESHREIHRAYSDCDKGLGGWDKPGPKWPYKPF